MEYAAREGLTPVQEYVDVETAKQTGRTSFSEMTAFLRANPRVRVILVEKTDRLYRNLKDWVMLDDLDVEIHLVKERAVLSRDSKRVRAWAHLGKHLCIFTEKIQVERMSISAEPMSEEEWLETYGDAPDIEVSSNPN